MTITRTAKGTASDKSSGLILTISSVTLGKRMLVVGIAYDDTAGHPVIRWGTQRLTRIETQTGGGFFTRIYVYRRRKPQKTKDIVATWTTTAPTAKAMVASSVSEIGTLDLQGSKFEAAVDHPDSGPNQTTNIAVEFLFGVLGSEGPVEDTVGTVQQGYSSGQRAGTTGGTADTNITIHEIYKIVSSVESTRARKTGTTVRDWNSCFTSWVSDKSHLFCIILSDFEDMEDIFDAADLDIEDGVMRYNILLGRLEMYEIDMTGATLKATWKPNTTTGWVTV